MIEDHNEAVIRILVFDMLRYVVSEEVVIQDDPLTSLLIMSRSCSILVVRTFWPDMNSVFLPQPLNLIL